MRRRFAVVAVALLSAAPALALDMPARKAGLWEMKMVFDGSPMPAQTMRQCIDQATDKAMQSQFGSGGAQGATCSKQDIKNAGGTTTFDTVCKIGPTTTATRGTITGSFDSAYTMKITSSSAGGPPIAGMAPGGETRMTIEAKYLGGCQAGQKPGDVVMSNGMKMNVLEMQKMGAGGMGAPGGMTPAR
jgi:Protein of unknown function (DUF3617)